MALDDIEVSLSSCDIDLRHIEPPPRTEPAGRGRNELLWSRELHTGEIAKDVAEASGSVDAGDDDGGSGRSAGRCAGGCSHSCG